VTIGPPLTALATYAVGAVAVLAAGHWIGWPWVLLCLLGACVDTAVCAWLVLWRRAA
jgi:hypothetical protein